MTFGIPTYNRPKVATAEYLMSFGVSPADIVIATQCERDFEVIKTRYAACRVIYRKGGCVGANRNTLLMYCQEHGIKELVMMDDDITSIHVKQGVKHRALTPAELIPSLEYCVREARQLGARLWGLYPVDNGMFMKYKIRRQSLLVGCVMGFLDCSLRFDADFRIKEDHELCCRLIANKEPVVRFDFFSPAAAHKTRGGCFGDWNKEGVEIYYASLLFAKYGKFLQIDNDGKEIRLKKQ